MSKSRCFQLILYLLISFLFFILAFFNVINKLLIFGIWTQQLYEHVPPRSLLPKLEFIWKSKVRDTTLCHIRQNIFKLQLTQCYSLCFLQNVLKSFDKLISFLVDINGRQNSCVCNSSYIQSFLCALFTFYNYMRRRFALSLLLALYYDVCSSHIRPFSCFRLVVFV